MNYIIYTLSLSLTFSLPLYHSLPISLFLHYSLCNSLTIVPHLPLSTRHLERGNQHMFNIAGRQRHAHFTLDGRPANGHAPFPWLRGTRHQRGRASFDGLPDGLRGRHKRLVLHIHP